MSVTSSLSVPVKSRGPTPMISKVLVVDVERAAEDVGIAAEAG